MEKDTRNSAAWNKIRHVDVGVRTWRYIDANKIIPYYVISTVVRGWMRLSEKLDVDVDWLRLQLSPFYFSPRRRPRSRPVSFFASWANSAKIFPRARREEERGLGIFRRLFPSASFLPPAPPVVFLPFFKTEFLEKCVSSWGETVLVVIVTDTSITRRSREPENFISSLGSIGSSFKNRSFQRPRQFYFDHSNILPVSSVSFKRSMDDLWMIAFGNCCEFSILIAEITI